MHKQQPFVKLARSRRAGKKLLRFWALSVEPDEGAALDKVAR
jgi:hypothetical protein